MIASRDHFVEEAGQVVVRGKPSDPDLPKEFLNFGACLYQGFDEEINTEVAFINHLAEDFSDHEAVILRAFLGNVVESAPADEVLQMWNSVVPDYYFYDGEQIRRMLALVRDKLGQGRMRPGWRPVGEGTNHGRLVQAPSRPKRR